MSTHNISFYEDLTKIVSKLSSNMHLIILFFCSFVITRPGQKYVVGRYFNLGFDMASVFI